MNDTTTADASIYKAIIKSLPHAIVALNERREILFCNTIAQSLFGISLMQTYLKNIEDVIPDSELRRMIDEVQLGGELREMDLSYEREGGEKKTLNVLIKKISLIEGGIKDIILITFEEICEENRLDVEKVYSEKLEHIVQAASGLAHELGNSLYCISSTLQFIKKEDKIIREDQGIASDIDFLMDNVDQMTVMLSSLLDLGDFERIHFENEDIHAVINRTIALAEKDARQRHIVIATDFYKGLPLLWIDKRQLEYAFLNLLKNAIESISDSGQVWFKSSFSPGPSDGKEGLAIIEVGDTGIGIAEEELNHIFKPFFSTKKGGHGLGLFLCRQIVEGHNGSINVRSEKGSGSVFTITFPVLSSPPESL